VNAACPSFVQAAAQTPLWRNWLRHIIHGVPLRTCPAAASLLHPHTPPTTAPRRQQQETAAMSESSNSPPSQHEFQAPKRKATQAGLDGHATGRSVKRRASKACQCCRARKVRCNVTEHGAPCTNCRLDEVDCIVSESRRKKSVIPENPASDDPSPMPFPRRRRWCL
jgi:hypothetical protein